MLQHRTEVGIPLCHTLENDAGHWLHIQFFKIYHRQIKLKLGSALQQDPSRREVKGREGVGGHTCWLPDEDLMKEPTKDRARGVRRRRPSTPGVRVQREADQWRGGVMAPASSTSACLAATPAAETRATARRSCNLVGA